MTRELRVHRIAPGATVQDRGRAGYRAFGVSQGGAADRLALAEGAALLGQSEDLAVLEMPGSGGVFEVSEPTRIALVGAPMRVKADDTALAWNASHLLRPGMRLEIGGATQGSYGYLHVGGGFATARQLGARSAHLAAGIGRTIKAGDHLPIGADPGSEVGLTLPTDSRFEGGDIRIVESFQTPLFDEATRSRFALTEFRRDARANRMGMRLNSEDAGFPAKDGLNILSEAIIPGDIQITGDGTPYLLLNESQTTGGYPRIGTVIPADLPKAVQTPPGGRMRLVFVPRGDALAALRKMRVYIADLPKLRQPLVRDPTQIRDLLSYQLISGATAGDTPMKEE